MGERGTHKASQGQTWPRVQACPRLATVMPPWEGNPHLCPPSLCLKGPHQGPGCCEVQGKESGVHALERRRRQQDRKVEKRGRGAGFLCHSHPQPCHPLGCGHSPCCSPCRSPAPARSWQLSPLSPSSPAPQSPQVTQCLSFTTSSFHGPPDGLTPTTNSQCPTHL